MAENSIVSQIDILSGLEVRFSQPYTAIDFPQALLETLLMGVDKAASALHPQDDCQDGVVMKTDPVAALRQILGNYVTEKYLSVDLVADLAGLTPRGLQRVLKVRGSSYRALLNDARRDYAQQQLQDPGVSASEVASQLGYREAGHFTRAFKRWTGVTPNKFRTRSK